MAKPAKKYPPAPVLPGLPGRDPTLKNLLEVLKVSQWWPEGEITAFQDRQLAWLLGWAASRVPWYESTDWARRLATTLNREPASFAEVWRQVPLLTKPQLRALGPQLNARAVPPHELPLGMLRTSGSTGIPVELRATATTRLWWDALTLREHLWSRRDFMARMGVIRSRKRDAQSTDGVVSGGWGKPVSTLFASGPASAMHIGRPMTELADWLLRFDPRYLLTYPSIMPALMDELAARGSRPAALEEVRFISEPLDPELVTRLEQEWQVRSADLYSANEVGYMAFRCREQGALHVQSEALRLEVLDDRGEACAPGETGRVVVTALHNLATPLLRYEIGDYATVGEACPCGRSLPVLARIQGRVRNLVRTPDGRRYWPTALLRIRTVAPIMQAQFVQTTPDTVELRVVLSRPLTAEETSEARQKVRDMLKYPFEVVIVPMAEIARGPTGKFEEFLSLLPD